jgi:hypothetical protein
MKVRAAWIFWLMFRLTSRVKARTIQGTFLKVVPWIVSRAVLLVVLWVLRTGGLPALGQTSSWPSSECPGDALEFKVDIRVPDEWEDRWEEAWPDIAEPMQAWRDNNFASLQGLWRYASPCIVDWTERAIAHDLPPSAGWLPLWMGSPALATSPCDCVVPDEFWHELSQRKEDPVGALAWLHERAKPTPKGTPNGKSGQGDSWGATIRTGIRLMENLNMPVVHITRPGDTVYKVGRQYKVSPECISLANGVWNDLRPGVPLLIPFAE